MINRILSFFIDLSVDKNLQYLQNALFRKILLNDIFFQLSIIKRNRFINTNISPPNIIFIITNKEAITSRYEISSLI